MNGHDPDTMTFTIKKTGLALKSFAAFAGSLAFIGGLIFGAVRWGVNEIFEDRIEKDLKDPESALSLRLDARLEDKVVEVIQAVVDDDLAYQDLKIERNKEDIERLEGHHD